MNTIKRFGRLRRKSVVVAAIGGGVLAMGGVAYSVGPFNIEGSDTLFDTTTDAINQSGEMGILVYKGGGSGKAETDMLANTQAVGPMSRNFRPSTITAHPTWQHYVLGLDAAVIDDLSDGSHGCADLTLAVQPDPDSGAGAKKFLNGNDLQLILCGVNGDGTPAACSAQARLDAIDRLSNCVQAPIQHFLRRDDNSGTTDTIKEKIICSRFCNGAAAGPTNAANEDKDPLRKGPVPTPAGATAYPSHHPDGTICDPTMSLAGCTNGFVVAFSEIDTGATSVTTTMTLRVKTALSGSIVAYAGRESVQSPLGQGRVSAPTINTNGYSDDTVRDSNQPYPPARRLFLQSRLSDTTGIDPSVVTEETKLNAFAQDRCKMDPIMVARGFVACADDCTSTFTNLCTVTNSGTPAIPTVCSKAPGQACSAGQVCCAAGDAQNTNYACPGTTCNKLGTGGNCSDGSNCTSGTCNINSTTGLGTCS